MVIEPLGDLKLSGVNANLLSVPTGFAFGIITGLRYSVNLPKLALYQTELRPDIQLKIFQMWSNMWSKAILDRSF